MGQLKKRETEGGSGGSWLQAKSQSTKRGRKEVGWRTAVRKNRRKKTQSAQLGKFKTSGQKSRSRGHKYHRHKGKIRMKKRSKLKCGSGETLTEWRNSKRQLRAMEQTGWGWDIGGKLGAVRNQEPKSIKEKRGLFQDVGRDVRIK